VNPPWALYFLPMTKAKARVNQRDLYAQTAVLQAREWIRCHQKSAYRAQIHANIGKINVTN
jgi:hypothetical protein